ncbi:SAM-dependent methyltransferase [Sphaerisporangium perillae]|uniref:SAM-dependent methyltransferase n=1 Tax=Sphaerisporangium perillae TaxID=2935860 RepID=UPI0027E19056|nr:SAM-dependent methyltransferase [Sphaerisporangium perillae]
MRYLAGECGIWQFLDIGTGLPTQENVHQVAQRTDPRARVVYVDNDPLVLVHARALLADTHVMAGDLREPWTIFE